MKAKEYAVVFDGERAKGHESLEALVIVLHAFTREFCELTTKRGANSESAMLACFKEMEQKYRAFCRLASSDTLEVKPEGWAEYLKQIHPDMWDVILVMQMRERARK
jgi:hypothetical protein